MPIKNYNRKTIDWLRSQDFEVERVEQYNSFTRKRSDLFGIIDYLAISETDTIGVQSTGYNGKSTHLNTIMTAGITPIWLQAGRRLWLVCWKRTPAGKRFRYTPQLTEISLVDAVLSKTLVG